MGTQAVMHFCILIHLLELSPGEAGVLPPPGTVGFGGREEVITLPVWEQP